MRVAQSITDDLQYTTTKGYTKPAKHLCIRVGIKSMKGSQKFCIILHRLGDAISCSQEGESITETADRPNISNSDHATPEGISLELDLATAIIWDNYDKTTSTLEGLHDTMGNVTQNVTFSPTVRRGEPAALAEGDVESKKKMKIFIW